VPQFQVTRLSWDDALLREIEFPKAKMRITQGIGSGLTRCATDVPGIFWAIGDRGPNIKIDVALEHYGLDNLRSLAALDGAKMMPALDIGPALAQLRIDGDKIVLLQTVPLRNCDDTAFSGLPVPASLHSEFEPIFAADGAVLGTVPSGADSEGAAAMADGSFWICDEYGPSLLHVTRAGRVLVRWVPQGTEGFYAGADYPVQPVLPAIAAARRLNRGFEAICLSSDETSIYIAFQSPLAHPDRAAYERSRHVRIWKLDAKTGAHLAEYLYPLDKPSAFLRDAKLGDVDRSDIKISEIIMLNESNLLVLERISASTKFYRVDTGKADPVPAQYLDTAIRPTLEQMTREDLKSAEIPVLDKTLIFDTDEAPEISADLEGMLLLCPSELLLVNDNDFGVEGVSTHFWRVRFQQPIC
jgi:Esterase-like activity of phytase